MRVMTIGLTAVAAVTVALPLLPAFTPRAALASGVVGTGSAASCTDAALNTALTGGGLVTFNCGGGLVTIDISTGTGTKTISADTTIDGGSLITISGGNSVGVFSVNTGITFTVQNLSIANGYSQYGDGGGIDNENGGTLTVTNSTFSGNSGGSISNLYGYGAATLRNTIVANSTSGGNCGGGVTDGGHNIDDGTTCGFSAANGSLNNTDPKLDPAGLANNGGPTQTIALKATSPAINAGDEAVCSAAPVNSLDQRGFVRPGTGAVNCSIGAYEYNSPGPPPPCAGDCNGDGQVTVDEILTMVNIALGNAQLSDCTVGDANHDGQITVDEILTAVNNALNGCGG